MQSSTFTFKASDGKSLFVHQWMPDAPPLRGLVHIAHGMAEHGGRYGRLAEALARAGYAVQANDHRGHGGTAERDEDLGFFASSGGWGRVVRDITELVDHWKKEHPSLPVILFGHSMGSFLVQEIMFERPDLAAAVVLSGSNGKPSPLALAGRAVARVERKRLGERGKSPLLHSLSFESFNKAFKAPRTPYDWLSRDEAEVDRYIADPRCGFVCSTALWIDLLDALPGLTKPENLAKIRRDLPIYVVAGAEDPVSERTKGIAKLVDTYRRAGLFRVTQRLYEGARHEIFNEVNRDAITADLIAWLDKNAAAPS
ncbi:MAG: alpha/beta hydrolase [Polyangiaceae bacterium]|nr:alpha/beta hydrolase [Polyangiaceae bacterium]NUQ79273.1 alpha/beta hydrolase [Polyangiaceae bacterium]